MSSRFSSTAEIRAYFLAIVPVPTLPRHSSAVVMRSSQGLLNTLDSGVEAKRTTSKWSLLVSDTYKDLY